MILLNTMKAALRVLEAVTYSEVPELSDVEALRRLTPFGDTIPLDELARKVVTDEINRRAE